jgi:hypothetical protein
MSTILGAFTEECKKRTIYPVARTKIKEKDPKVGSPVSNLFRSHKKDPNY